MLKRTKGYILLTLLVVTGLGSQVSNNTLSGKERRFLVHHLKETKTAFLTSVKGLSEAQLNFKPAGDKWSIKECIQHVSLVEEKIWNITKVTLEQPVALEKHKQIRITDADLLKNNIVQTQMELCSLNYPRQTLTKENLNNFKSQRNKTIKYIKTTTNDVRNHIAETSSGLLDGYQLVLMMSAHTNHHIQQIEAIKANPAFPE